jgi:CubicO group peptidase (beta-lactamase class C family)
MPPRPSRLLRHAFPWSALALMLGALALVLGRAAWIGTGFFAKQLCSETLVAGRDPSAVVAQDLLVLEPAALFRSVSWQVGADGASASLLGILHREARYLPATGCVLRSGWGDAVPPSAQAAGPPSSRSRRAAYRAKAAPRRLQSVVEAAFDEPDPSRPRRTRAVLILQGDRVLAERYADGFDAQTRFCGWSVTKSVVNALLGVLAARHVLDLHDPVPIAAWQRAGDARAALTFDHLLHMSSGLAFDERYDDPFSDVTTMLYASADLAGYAARKPLVAPPDSQFSYASGTTNLLTRALRELHVPGIPYEALPAALLFDRLGMRSAMIEMDETGTFVGSSYMYATARDWARFGALYAADGVWNGERLLPPGWVRYSATRAPADGQGRYGAHFWLYDPEERDNARRLSRASIPNDAFFAGGFGGQRITIIPSRRLVIVRLGYTLDQRAWNNAGFVAQVLEALAAQAL